MRFERKLTFDHYCFIFKKATASSAATMFLEGSRMINIIITSEEVGQARLYEKLKRQGRFTLVPTYKATANTDTGEKFEFAVTRDSSSIRFFGQIEQFGTNGECPASRAGKPYLAKASTLSSDNTFSLRLYESELGDNAIRGVSNTTRTGIMIHRGPGRSMGCLQVAGGKKGHRRFERWFKARIDAGTNIVVEVLPYS